MSHYKPYPAYKDSGVEWIGDVPEGWERHKVSHSFTGIGSGTTPPTDQEEWYSDEGIPWVTTGELRETVINATSKYVTTKALDEFSALHVYPAGSLAMAMYGATIGRLGILGIHATTNQACCVLYGEKSLNIRFSYYWLLAFKPEIIELYAVGGGQPNINQEVVASLRIPAPTIDEQSAIAAMLDRETARIDALISKKTRFIELLKEKRSALITHAVTKGLDPRVKMKDSGVEWIGQVPEGWGLIRLGMVGSLVKANGGNKQDDADTGVPCIRYGDIYTTYDLQIHNIKKFIKPDAEQDYTSIHYGDILFAASGETFEEIGKSVVNLSQSNVYCGGDIIILRPEQKFNPVFLAYATGSSSAQAQKSIMGKGFTVIHIYGDQLRNVVIALPSKQEQKFIADRIDRETARIDLLTEKTQHSIDLLKERRSAFISAAVTGQIDLRGETA